MTGYGLVILWPKFVSQKKIVQEKLAERFDLLAEIDLEWPKGCEVESFRRFYGDRLSGSSINEKGVSGPFKIFFFKSRCVEEVFFNTSQGFDLVSKDLFLLKKGIRKDLKTKFGIHGSNNVHELKRDIRLLFNMSLEDFLSDISLTGNNKQKKIVRMPDSWGSEKEFFQWANDVFEYVVLRPFDIESDDSDIDLLVRDRERVAYFLGLKKCSKGFERANYNISLKDKVIDLDIRQVGDNYFDPCWQNDVLVSRVLSNGLIYKPNEDHAKWTLVYHALIHKRSLPTKYEALCENIDESKQKLFGFMYKNNYRVVEPNDVTLYFNTFHGGSIKFSRERRWRQSSSFKNKLKLKLKYLFLRMFNLQTRA